MHALSGQDYHSYILVMSPPIKWGDMLFSALLSVCMSGFRVALYLLNPGWDLQITLHKCQV